MLQLVMMVSALMSTSSVSGQCNEGSARLRILTSSGPNAGRFEICLGNQYGTVQLSSPASFWSEKNTLVACRQLGFEGALNTIPPSQLSSLNYAPSSTPVHYRSVSCLGTESSIANCSTRSANNASHNTDVFIVCWPSGSTYTNLHSNVSNSKSTTGSIRLVGGSRNGQGVVEILTGIGWSTICPDRAWTSSVATDICQYLGYENGSARIQTMDSSLVSPRLVQDPKCLPIIENPPLGRIEAGFCSFLSTDSSTCIIAGGRYASVTCTSNNTKGSSRLFGVDIFNSSRVIGVVEYFANGRWGVMCRPSTPTEVGKSVCDGFGYSRDEATTITLNVNRVESRMKPLWIPDILCDSSDRNVSQCSLARPLGYGTCGSTRDILAVDCGPKRSPFNLDYIAAIVIVPLVVIGIFVLLCIIIYLCCFSSSQSNYKTGSRQERTSSLRVLRSSSGEEHAALAEPLLPPDVPPDVPNKPKEEFQSPCDPSVAMPTAPPPQVYPISQGDPAYLPLANPGAGSPYPTPHPPGMDVPYPSGALLPHLTSPADHPPKTSQKKN